MSKIVTTAINYAAAVERVESAKATIDTAYSQWKIANGVGFIERNSQDWLAMMQATSNEYQELRRAKSQARYWSAKLCKLVKGCCNEKTPDQKNPARGASEQRQSINKSTTTEAPQPLELQEGKEPHIGPAEGFADCWRWCFGGAAMMQIIAYSLFNAPAIAYTLRQVLVTPNKQRQNRHDSAVLSCPNCAISPSAAGGNGYGQDEPICKDGCTSVCVLLTSCPPNARSKANGGLLLKQESETMATLSLARAATTTSKQDTIPTEKLTAVLGAFNACNLASSYIERGNFAAARRKLVLALRDIEALTKSEGGAA